MTFLWPFMFFALLAIPVVVVMYLRLQRRERVLTASFYRPSGGPSAVRRTPSYHRHLPALFFLLGLAIVLVALARPHAQLSLPRVEGTVMLVFDVSASMAATDVEPSRLEAAKATAREFVLSQPATVRIGIVAFSGSGFTVQAPTDDTNALLATINRLQPASGTSVGQGIATALNAIAIDIGLAPSEPSEASAIAGSASPAQPGSPPIQPGNPPVQPGGQGPQSPRPPGVDLLARLPEGEYPASTIVLLSDGENTQPIDPLEAAQAAADHGVRVDALGFGTPAGATLEVDGFRVHTALDEATLQAIVQVAEGTYYPARGERDMRQVYASLTPEVVVRADNTEVTAVFAGAGILLLLAGGLFSTLWFNRLP